MTPIIRPDWWLPESAATDESIYRNRRDILKALGIGSVSAGLALSGGLPAAADTSDLYPVDRNPNFAATLNGRPMTIACLLANTLTAAHRSLGLDDPEV